MDSVTACIDDIEERLRAAKVSVARVCREAGIDRSIWHKWKFDGVMPRPATWNAVRAVLAPKIGAVAELPVAAADAKAA